MAAPSALNSLSSLYLRAPSCSSFSLLPLTNKLNLPLLTKTPHSFLSLSVSATPKAKSSDDDGDIDTSNPEEDLPFNPPEIPEGYIGSPSIYDGPVETEDDIAAAYEKLYGPAYSGVAVLGNDINVMDRKAKKETRFRSGARNQKIRDGFEERVVQVRRVTKVVKGGKQMRFRAIVVVGNKRGEVGVGVGKAKEVIAAVQKSAIDARRNIVRVPLTKYLTFPHRSDGDFGAAKVMLRPASPGTGVIAGGSVKIVLEMAGVENALGKQLGSDNALNNARATVVAVQKMKQFSEVAEERGIPMEELWK